MNWVYVSLLLMWLLYFVPQKIPPVWVMKDIVNFLKHVFEKTVNPKGPTSDPTFWRGLGPRPFGVNVAVKPIFSTIRS